jgi:3D (Asp-Asp-Asp) domain-containing protein
MAASIPHPHGLFSGRRAAQLGASWATVHRDDTRAIHLRTLLLLLGLSLGSAAAALLVAHLLSVGSPPATILRNDPLGTLTRAPPHDSAVAASAAPPRGVHAATLRAATVPSVLALPALDATPATAPARVPTPADAGSPAVAPLETLPLKSLPALALALAPADPPATRTVVAKVTGYCPCTICCGARAAGITAINRNVYRHPRGIAVDPRLLAYRSYLSVPGYGTAMVDDTGAAMRADGDHGVIHLDVRFKTHEEALLWGVRWLPIEVPVASQAAQLPAADETPAQ